MSMYLHVNNVHAYASVCLFVYRRSCASGVEHGSAKNACEVLTLVLPRRR